MTHSDKNATTPRETCVSATTFLNTVFPAELLGPQETVAIACPAEFTRDGDGEVVHYHKQLAWPRQAKSLDTPQGWLFCVSTVKRVSRGDKTRIRLVDVRQAFVLVCDDIGTKALPPPVAPSYILETSPGNYQYGFLLEPLDVSTAAGAAYFDACLVALADAGYNDKGCRSASRKVKLPGALHKSGFEARICAWSPQRVWQLPELMNEMDVVVGDYDVPPQRQVSHHQSVTFTDIDDVVLDWLRDQGMVTGGNNDTWLNIRCPWDAGHSNAGADNPGSSTVYSPLLYGEIASRAFNCKHGTCAERSTEDFITWCIEQGCEDPAKVVQQKYVTLICNHQ